MGRLSLLATDFGISLLVILVCCVFAYKSGKLTAQASALGGLFAFILVVGAGYPSLIMLAAFFAFGSAATAWNYEKKSSYKLQEQNNGRRTPGQVVANGGLATVLALLVIIYPQYTMYYQIMIAAGFASATSDTLSSEMGNLYGSSYYNVLTFKKDQRGLDGVISLEGTLFGLAGAAIIALIYVLSFHWSADFYSIVLAGIGGNLVDSLLGATLERKKIISNNTVNFLNTCSAALLALLFSIDCCK